METPDYDWVLSAQWSQGLRGTWGLRGLRGCPYLTNVWGSVSVVVSGPGSDACLEGSEGLSPS